MNTCPNETETTLDVVHPSNFQRLPIRNVDAESLRPEFKGGHDVPKRSRPECNSQKGEFRMTVSRQYRGNKTRNYSLVSA